MPERRAASFMLKNSKGHPDFVMTMLVAVTMAMFVVVLVWILFNLLAIRMTATPNPTSDVLSMMDRAITLLASFNENARLIVLGFASSVFGLAGAYYLRRASYDKHYEAMKKTNLEQGIVNGDSASATGFLPPGQSTLLHPNYDDSEEDI
jgi:acetyl-CoA acetyltransferase